jgi:anti-sigma B factor antagonist
VSIEIRIAEGVTGVALHDKLAVDQGAVEIRAELPELLRRGQNKILLNLGDVNYVDSV